MAVDGEEVKRVVVTPAPVIVVQKARMAVGVEGDVGSEVFDWLSFHF